MLGSRIFKGSLIYGIGSIVVNGSSFLLIPIYTQYLTPTEYGILGSVTIMNSLIISVLGLGFSGVISRFYYDFDDSKEWRSFFSSTSKFMLVFGLLVTLSLFFYGEPLLDRLFKSVRFEPYLKLGIWIGFLGIIPSVPLALLQVKGEALKYRGFTMLSFVILTFFMVLFVIWMKQGVLGGLRAQLIAGILMGIMYIYYIAKEGTTAVSVKHIPVALKFGLPLMLYSFSGLITEMSSRYFVERFASLSDLGIFNLAQQYSSGLILVISAVNMAWVPIFYERAKENNSEVFSKFGMYLVAFAASIGLLMSLYAHEFVTLIAAKSYSGASEVIPILILSYFVGNGLWILFVNPICYTKQTKYLPLLTAISGISCLFLNILLVPQLGILGAAISLLISYIILICFAFWISNKVFPIRYNIFKMILILLISICVYLISILYKTDIMILYMAFKFCLFLGFLSLLFFLDVLPIKEMVGSILIKRNNRIPL